MAEVSAITMSEIPSPVEWQQPQSLEEAVVELDMAPVAAAEVPGTICPAECQQPVSLVDMLVEPGPSSTAECQPPLTLEETMVEPVSLEETTVDPVMAEASFLDTPPQTPKRGSRRNYSPEETEASDPSQGVGSEVLSKKTRKAKKKEKKLKRTRTERKNQQNPEEMADESPEHCKSAVVQSPQKPKRAKTADGSPEHSQSVLVQSPSKPKRAKTVDGSPEHSQSGLMQSPSKPKRAKTAYGLFCDEHRLAVMDDIRAKNDGDLNLQDLGRELGERWSKVPVEERIKYQNLAGKDKERHSVEMQGFLETTDPVSALMAKYADLIPKRPAGAYFLFMQDKAQRAKAEDLLKMEGKDVSVATLGAKLGQLWHTAPPELKADFTARNEKAVSEYAGKTKAWQETPEYAELERAKQEHGFSGKRKKLAKQKDFASGKQRQFKITAAKTFKKTRSSKPKQVKPPKPAVEPTVLDEAKKLGLAFALVEVARCEELRERGYTAESKTGALALLRALRRSQGKVDKAKEIVLAWRKRRKMLTTLDINETVWAEAERMDLDVPFMELVNCEVVARKGLRVHKQEDAQVMLDVLKRTDGQVEEAIDAILAA